MKQRRSAVLLTAVLSYGCASNAGGEAGAAGGEHAGSGAALGAAGHSGSPASDPEVVDCANAPQYADVAAFHKCTMCHSSERSGAARSGAPAAVNFDSEEAASPYATAMQRAVYGGIMPPRSSGLTLSEAEKQQFYAWAMCVN